MKNNKILFIAQGAVIAALYVAFAYLSNLFGLASGAIQVRISEAFCVLAAFTPAAVPGLTIGCFLFNLTSGCVIQDVLFGSLATFIGAGSTFFMAAAFKKRPVPAKSFTGIVRAILLPLPTVLANAFIVPMVLIKFYGLTDAYWYLFATVALGEFIAAEVIGLVLYFSLQPIQQHIFVSNN